MKLHKFIQSIAIGMLAMLAVAQYAHTQATFNSGSDGSYGPLVVDATTGSPKYVAIPPNGILNCTTVKIDPGYELYFTKNASNTPVYILATGDVTIGGNIYVNGSANVGRRGGDGGPGGFAGGQGGTSPSNGFGPGGGKGGWSEFSALPNGKNYHGGGGYATKGSETVTGGNTYGNSLLIPLVGGSGGGGAEDTATSSQIGGAGGGGAILIASNTKITFSQGVSYNIFAQGGSTSGRGGGSGGAVRVVAPIVTGTASFYILGVHGGGFGRSRVDALTNSLNLRDENGSAGYSSFGANMVVFPTNLPELRITKAAGTDIALTQTDPVFVLLPAGAPTTQSVAVQAKNFNSSVPLVAVVTPEAGDRTTYNFTIDNTAGGTASGTVQVQIPAGVSTRIDVWTR